MIIEYTQYILFYRMKSLLWIFQIDAKAVTFIETKQEEKRREGWIPYHTRNIIPQILETEIERFPGRKIEKEKITDFDFGFFVFQSRRTVVNPAGRTLDLGFLNRINFASFYSISISRHAQICDERWTDWCNNFSEKNNV